MRHALGLLLNSTGLSRATFNTEPVIIVPATEQAAPVGELIDQIVEARVDAAEATEDAAEAIEVAEAAAERVEELSEWQLEMNRQLSALQERCGMLPTQAEFETVIRTVEEIKSAQLIPPSLSDLSAQELSTLEETTIMATAEAAETAAVEALAESPEAMQAAAVVASGTPSLETPTEASSETPTEALSESPVESPVPVLAAVAVRRGQVLRARLI